jgi:hypothetical protein
MGLEFDSGGNCDEACIAPAATAEAVERANHYKRNMEERGNNNPYLYETVPQRLRYAYGAGCMNPDCKCVNCQGSCLCDPNKKKMMRLPNLKKPISWHLVLLVIVIVLVALYLKKKYL